MCGIVGYLGDKEATPILVGGLRRLEYRGYDSAGVAVANGTGAKVVRCRGKLAALEKLLETERTPGTVGIGHTRWATHGRPSDENAHPHKAGPISVVHNGIIENHVGLRVRLKAAGRTFTSETDTEIVAHLIDEALKGGASNLAEAVRKALRQVEGAYALVVLSDDHPDEVIAAKDASPLVVGLGKGENFLASDVPALLEHTRDVLFLEDGDMAVLSRDGVTVTDLEGRARQRTPKTITWSAAQAEKAGYPHFMLKEIHEQPRAVTDTLRGRLLPDKNDAILDGYEVPADVKRVVLLACGTSYHAGLVGKFLIENTARIPCEVDLASEFRYREPVVGPNDLVVGISQSGETADTLAAIKEAKSRGARTLAICNVVDSAIARVLRGDAVHPRRAGDRRGLHQVLHRPAGGAGAAGDPHRAAHGSAERSGGGRADPRAVADSAQDVLRPSGPERGEGHRRQVQEREGLPVPGARDQLPHRARGRPEAEGDLVHPRRGLRRGRDETRAHRADRRRHPGGGDHPAGQGLRQGAVQPGRGAGARRRR